MTKERIHWIDIAKGIAIICVFIGHTVSTPLQFQRFVYLFHMPAFFLLSGYCFSNRRKFGDFLISKLKTIIVPVFTLGLGGSILVALMLQFVKHETVDWKWTFLNPVVQCGQHSLLWYLPALFVVMLIFYGLTKLLKDKNIPIIVCSFLLALASYCYIKLVNFRLPWCIDTALVALPFTAIGYVMKKSGKTEKCGKIWVLILSFAVCMAVGTCNIVFFHSPDMHENLYGNILLFYVAAFSGIIMLLSASMIIKKNRILEYFGRNSLVFYAFEPIQYFINFVLKTLGFQWTEYPNTLILYVVTVIAVAVIAALSCVASAVVNKFFPFFIGKSGEVKS